MMRVTLLSDTHGFLDPRIAEWVRRSDWAVHAGDVGDTAVIEQLRSLARVLVVRGNNDLPGKWSGSNDTLAALPEQAELELPGGRLAVVHGHRAGGTSGRHGRLRRQHPGVRAIVYGHSHRLACDLDDEPWVLNPGAAGRARTFGGPSCIVLEAGPSLWQVRSLRFEPLNK